MSDDTTLEQNPDTTAAVVPEPLEGTPERTFKQSVSRFGVLLAFEGVAKAAVAKARAELTDQMLTAYDDMGTDRFKGHDLDGVPVVKFSLRKSAATSATFRVADPSALLSWTLVNHPTEVEYVVRPSFLTALLSALAYEDGEVINTATGTTVDGIEFVPAKPEGRPTGFGTNWETGGKDRLLEMLAGERVADVLDLPELEAAP